jgi:hypothetical protein
MRRRRGRGGEEGEGEKVVGCWLLVLVRREEGKRER